MLVATTEGYEGQLVHAGKVPEKTELQSLTIAHSEEKRGCIFYKWLEKSRMRMWSKNRVGLGDKAYICS